MATSLICEIDNQIFCLQQLTRITESLKEKCIKLEKDKSEAIEKYEAVKIKLERLNNKKCTNCSFLTNELRKERKQKEKLKMEEKAKLLKMIARTLESLDDGNTNHVNQLLTELNCGILSQSPEQEKERHITLIDDRDSNEDEDQANILVNETVIIDEDKEASNFFKRDPIIIPETEVMEYPPQQAATKNVFKDISIPRLKNRNISHSKENLVSLENEDVIEQASKKLRLSPILSSQKVSPPRDKTRLNHSARSPSVLSEIIEAAGGSASSSSYQDEKGVAWKMKPGVLMESACPNAATGGRKLKQLTLSVARAEKKHDISLSNNFKGGVAKHSDEDDVVHPSPERNSKKSFVKKIRVVETLEDPDMTVFNPITTSTCLPIPVETSYDRLPEMETSPKYKYRRETVRKKCERMKLPGQDCDQCAKYYEAAGLDQPEDVRARLNQCSKHRDKYQLRANTPPGFWDPVLPATPEDSLDHL